MVGVILVNKFLTPGSKRYKTYIDYLDREEAVRNKYFEKYSYDFSDYKEYVDGYMNNPEKTTGIFTKEKDNLSFVEKLSLKNLFELAEYNGSNMWQTVISFDNGWLKENGLCDDDYNRFNETKIKEYARSAMSELLKKEGFENAVWSAAIHYNTDNIHVHFAFVEPEPSTEVGKGRYRTFRNSGYSYQKGVINKTSLEAAKRNMVGNIISEQSENEKINKLIRDTIIGCKREKPIVDDENLKLKFEKLIDALPADMRKWKYGNKVMIRYHSIIDAVSEDFINTYFKDEYAELLDLLNKQQSKYDTAYGMRKDGSPNEFKNNKINDLYKRLGNTILKEAREYVKREKANMKSELDPIYEFMMDIPIPLHRQLNKRLESKYSDRMIDEMLDMLQAEYQSEDYDYFNIYSNQYKELMTYISEKTGKGGNPMFGKSAMEISRALRLISKAMRKDMDSAKNQATYQRMNKDNEEEY